MKKPDPKEGPEEGHPSEEKTEKKDVKEGQKEVHEAEKETLPEQEIKVIEKEDKEAVPEKEMIPEAKAGKKKTGGELKVIRRDGRFQLVPVTEEQEAVPEEPSEMTWRYPQYPAEPTPTPPAPRPARYQQAMAAPMPERPQPQVGPTAWDRYPGQRQEVIRIDLKALQSGDMRQNIVIRPGDYIQVPYNDVGIFYVMGQVSRPGPYSLQGERMTLKQAMTVAGPMSPLADLTQCDITRRIGKDREVTCRINLKKLMEGSQPDVFIKPQDIVNVGSHPLARWIAVIRQSFRTTYGFGFVYDRNLADKDFGH